MKINAKCPCGAEFNAEDQRGIYINRGGAADSEGRIYQLEIVLDRWRADHAKCPDAIRVGKMLASV